ncbi:CQS_1a_G0026850.mRNA.1.CDS.1 [Saccharomyces cerevisiae]|nr:CQS_1a_G0026850.mRNA.1.CDS.1 [Saccharomyces cerevisiae]CAI7336956.1 CQS_1a_G0026850.mRNA.1.CDS.1 [Saccharomyces cerevisiae]
MSGLFFNLKESDSVSFMGPVCKYDWKPNKFEQVNLLCGGSGITPMFQLIRHILENPNDKTKVNLFYANKTKDDILLRNELEGLKQRYPGRISLNYYIEKGTTEDGIKKGYIAKDDLLKIDPAKKYNVFPLRT